MLKFRNKTHRIKGGDNLKRKRNNFSMYNI